MTLIFIISSYVTQYIRENIITLISINLTGVTLVFAEFVVNTSLNYLHIYDCAIMDFIQ